MRPLIISSGFLGREIDNQFQRMGLAPIATFHSNRHSSNALRFNLLSQKISDIVDISEIDAMIFVSKIEDSSDTSAIAAAMKSLFHECRYKRVIYLSTDAVFDGKKGMYRETDVPNPLTLYGKHKLLCEDLLRRHVENHCIVRSSYIYGYSIQQLDSRLHNAKSLIADGCEVRKFVNMYKSPVEVKQLAGIVTGLAESPHKGVLHACGKRMSVYEFFKQSLLALGEDTRYLIAEHIPQDAPVEYLRDTSLDSGLINSLFKVKPIPLTFAFRETNLNNEWIGATRQQIIGHQQ